MAVIIPPTPISDFPGPLPNVVDPAFRQQALQWVNHLTTVKIGEFNALLSNVNNNAQAAAEAAALAEEKAADAAASAVDAAAGAEAAAGSATSANTAKTAAETARDDAQTARTQAQTAATNAGTSATNAANSAAAAAQSAADAEAIATGDLLANTAPEALGTSAVGTSSRAARADHVHLMPTAAQVGAVPAAHAGVGGAAHANATTSVDGFMSSADKTKLNGVASDATANATDSQLRDRSTHTGTQAQSTVTNLTTDLAARVNRQDSYATVTSGVINLGLETELYHITVSGNVTVSVSNAPTTSRVVKRLIVQYSSGVVTWPASFKLPTPMPTFAAGKSYVFSIEQSPNSGVYFLVPGPEYTYP